MIIHQSADHLVQATAARLLVAVSDVLEQRGQATIALTGGGVGTKVLAAIGESTLVRHIAWSRVQIWWGDDRFVPADHEDRNERQAREALLEQLPLPPTNVHPMPAATTGLDVNAAAEQFSVEFTRLRPQFDIVLLGAGPDGHVASLFPQRPDLLDAAGPIVAVTNSPKPPPERLSLSLAVINAAREVWLIAGGAEKANAVCQARREGSTLPAALARGTRRTLWLVDAAAATGRR